MRYNTGGSIIRPLFNTQLRVTVGDKDSDYLNTRIVMAKKDLKKLEELCDSFQHDNTKEVFKSIVSMALKLGVDKLELASECAVAPSTVLRWAEGSSVPAENVRALIVDTIAFLLVQD